MAVAGGAGMVVLAATAVGIEAVLAPEGVVGRGDSPVDPQAVSVNASNEANKLRRVICLCEGMGMLQIVFSVCGG